MPIEAEKIEKAYKELKTKLTPREREVITRFYGISPNVRHSLAEMGEMFQVTRERVRQIKEGALVKLRITKHKYGSKGKK